MNLKKRIEELEHENFELKLKNLKLQLDLEMFTTEWRHPNSCLNNYDPWQHLNFIDN